MRDCGDASFRSTGWRDPGRTRHDVPPMFEHTSPNGGRAIIIVSFSLVSRHSFLDVLLGDAQLHRLIPARRLDRLGRFAIALGRGPLDDRAGGGRPHSPVEPTAASCHCQDGRLSVAGPRGLVESGPELHTELSRSRASVHGIPWHRAVIRSQRLSAPGTLRSPADRS